MSKNPMTKREAENIVAEMRRETSKSGMMRLLSAALVIGNLSDDARAVYQAALETL
jgi:hypothetical protein